MARRELVERDDERFRALYHQTSRDLLAFLLRRAASSEDAADCLAETYLIVWDKRGEIPVTPEDARPWVFGVARNVLRRSRERESRSQQAAEYLAENLRRMPVVRHRPDPDEPLVEALAELSEIDREIVLMQAWDELKPREIGLLLGLSANVVRVRSHRAKVRLRGLMSPHSTARSPATRE